ncbi:hypothetical protein BpKM391_50360 [Burkholderia pseudomallei]|nr:hypothetical protein BpKM391_50360 [Burkholderia pseudomallei]
MPTTVSAPETLSETRTQTRELLLQTALSMLEQGWFPSITELANASGVSRATAYRYFPSQAALVSTVVDESLGPVLQWQPTSTSVEARVNELLDFAYPRMEQHEGALRAALQVALHQWANERARRAQDEPKYRRGNRRRLLTLAVEPMVRAGVDPAVAERLAQALSLLYGTEAMVVLKDIWGLDFRQFMNVIKWMSSALVRATPQDTCLLPYPHRKRCPKRARRPASCCCRLRCRCSNKAGFHRSPSSRTHPACRAPPLTATSRRRRRS